MNLCTTIESVRAQIEEISDLQNEFLTHDVPNNDALLNGLMMVIEELETKEEAFLARLGYSTFKDLQVAISTKYNSFLSKFSGDALRSQLQKEHIGEYNIDKDKMQLIGKFESYMSQIANQGGLRDDLIKDNKDKIIAFAIQQLKGFSGEGKRSVVTRSTEGLDVQNGMIKLNISKLTAETERRVRAFVEAIDEGGRGNYKVGKENTKIKYSSLRQGYKTQVKQNGNSVTATFEINSLVEATKGLTGKQYLQLLHSKSKRDRIEAEEIKQNIINFFGRISNNEGFKEFVIRQFDNEDQAASFFSGKNFSKGASGIYGELATAYVLSELLKNKSGSVKWIGAITGDGAQSHEDILVELGESLGFNVQVKNSTQEMGLANLDLDYVTEIFEREIAFFTSNVDGFFNYLGFTLTENNSDWIKNLYVMDKFNQVASFDKGEFIPVRGQIERTLGKMDAFYSMYADLLIYAATTRASEAMKKTSSGSLGGNNIYVLSGTNWQSSASILRDVLKKLQSENINNNNLNFRVRSEIIRDSKSEIPGFTYEQYIKERKKYTTNEERKQFTGSFKKEFSNRLRLTSYYKFSGGKA